MCGNAHPVDFVGGIRRAFRQSGQRQPGKREGRDPLAERGRLVSSAEGTEREKSGTHWLNVGAS